MQKSSRDSWRLWATLIFLIAFALRLTKIWVATPFVPSNDEPEFVSLARGLADSGTYRHPPGIDNLGMGGQTGDPTAFRTPGLPVFLALHLRLLGPSLIYPRLTLVFLSALSCVLIALVGRRSFSPQVGLLASATWSLWPPTMLSGYAADRLFCENLGVFLLIASVLLFLEVSERSSSSWAFASGILLGLAVLTRGFFVLIVPFFLLACVCLTAPRVKRAQFAICILGGVFLTLGLWVGRNWVVLGRPLISTQTEGFYLGNNPWARGSFDGEFLVVGWNSPQLKRMEQRYPGFRQMGELERSDAWKTEARRCVTEDPVRFAWLLFRKTLIFWAPVQDWRYGPYRHHYALAMILPFFVIGAFCLARNPTTSGIMLVGPILGVYLAALLTYSHDRYRFTIEPFIILIAAHGFFVIKHSWKNRFLPSGPSKVNLLKQ